MAGTIRPLRFLHRQKSLVSNLLRRHRKALLMVCIVAASYFAMNIASAVAFNQKAEIDGVRIETDKAVYMFGETVETRLYLVNGLDSAISLCFTGYRATVHNILGSGFVADAFFTISEPCGVLLQPHSETFLDSFLFFAGDSGSSIPVPIPGLYTMEATVRTRGTDVTFTGKTTMLVTMAQEL